MACHETIRIGPTELPEPDSPKLLDSSALRALVQFIYRMLVLEDCLIPIEQVKTYIGQLRS